MSQCYVTHGCFGSIPASEPLVSGGVALLVILVFYCLSDNVDFWSMSDGFVFVG